MLAVAEVAAVAPCTYTFIKCKQGAIFCLFFVLRLVSRKFPKISCVSSYCIGKIEIIGFCLGQVRSAKSVDWSHFIFVLAFLLVLL